MALSILTCPSNLLVQIAGLRNVDRNPTPILRLGRIEVIAGQSLEGSVQGINLGLILLPRTGRAS